MSTAVVEKLQRPIHPTFGSGTVQPSDLDRPGRSLIVVREAHPPAYWMNMQARFDLETARDKRESRIQSEVRPRNAA